eukprot:CAMPEP_0201477784 /NCGR_PEP_ID=MMETSP0151_2-20130828/2749_1 /ASSEMBLY_ACC=CAM_ASM_000257 /TAXON_ID=200890 /ORGANISM="Paramoeba atlantica, Strain 621/1 / CCAP 1560/9" /LENGTH=137 /DNA_ID=CAMNT_0047858623 /DNA_START=32 /DNA_END=445 /DNA_ORIENTATION=+
MAAPEKENEKMEKMERQEEWRENPEKEGWVVKYSYSSRGFRKRWVVLSNGTLYFFKSEKSTSPCFDWKVVEVTKSKKPIKEQNPFEITTIQEFRTAEKQRRARRFATETEQELEEWILAIEQSISPSFLKPAKQEHK